MAAGGWCLAEEPENQRQGSPGGHRPVSLVNWNVPGLVRDHKKGKEKQEDRSCQPVASTHMHIHMPWTHAHQKCQRKTNASWFPSYTESIE